MESEIVVVDVEWSEANGPLHSAGAPALFAWLHAFFGPAGGDGRAVVVARDARSEQWTQFARPITREQARQLADAIEALGLPKREPRVEPAVDTSDVWAALRVRVGAGETARAFDLYVQASGFEGPDAAPLRGIFRAVFALAGYEHDDEVLYGRRDRG